MGKSKKTIKDMDTYTKGNKSFKSTLAKTKATKKSVSSNKSLLIRNETNNNIHDLLHSNMASNLQYINEEDNENDDSDFDFSDDDDDMVMEFDNDGKMIIPDDDSVQKEENDDDESKDESMKQPKKKNRRVSKLENVKNAKQNKNKQKQL